MACFVSYLYGDTVRCQAPSLKALLKPVLKGLFDFQGFDWNVLNFNFYGRFRLLTRPQRK